MCFDLEQGRVCSVPSRSCPTPEAFSRGTLRRVRTGTAAERVAGVMFEETEQFLELISISSSSFTSPFWNRSGDVHFAFNVALDLGEWSGPHGGPRKPAVGIWLWWQEAFREWVKVVLSSLAQHVGKWTSVLAGWGTWSKKKRE